MTADLDVNKFFSKIELCDDLAVTIFEEVERNGVTIRNIFEKMDCFRAETRSGIG